MVRLTGDEDAGFLEQFADGSDDFRGKIGLTVNEVFVWRADLAAGEGVEATHEAQVVGPADQEDLRRTGAARQEDAGGLDDVARHGPTLPRAFRGAFPGAWLSRCDRRFPASVPWRTACGCSR